MICSICPPSVQTRHVEGAKRRRGPYRLTSLGAIFLAVSAGAAAATDSDANTALETACKPFCFYADDPIPANGKDDIKNQVNAILAENAQKEELYGKLYSDTGFPEKFTFSLAKSDTQGYVGKAVNRHHYVTMKDRKGKNRGFLVLGYTNGDLEIVEINLENNGYMYLPRLKSGNDYKKCYDDNDGDACALNYRNTASYSSIDVPPHEIVPVTALNAYVDTEERDKVHILVGYGNETLSVPPAMTVDIFRLKAGLTIGQKTAYGGGIYILDFDISDPSRLPPVSVVQDNTKSDTTAKVVTNLFVFTNAYRDETGKAIKLAGAMAILDETSLPAPLALKGMGKGTYDTSNHWAFKAMQSVPSIQRDGHNPLGLWKTKKRKTFALVSMSLDGSHTRSVAFTCGDSTGTCPHLVEATPFGLYLAVGNQLHEYSLTNSNGQAQFSRFVMPARDSSGQDLSDKRVTALSYNPLLKYTALITENPAADYDLIFLPYRGNHAPQTPVSLKTRLPETLADTTYGPAALFSKLGKTYAVFKDQKDSKNPMKIWPISRGFSLEKDADDVDVLHLNADPTTFGLIRNTDALPPNGLSFLSDNGRLLVSGYDRAPLSSRDWWYRFAITETSLCDVSDHGTAIDSCRALDYPFPGLPIKLSTETVDGVDRITLVSGKADNRATEGEDVVPAFDASYYLGSISYDAENGTVLSRRGPIICDYNPDLSDIGNNEAEILARSKIGFCYRPLTGHVSLKDYQKHIEN